MSKVGHKSSSQRREISLTASSEQTKGVRILIAETHTLVRAGLRVLLKEVFAPAFIIESASGREAITAGQTQYPDIVIIGPCLLESGGMNLVARVCKECPGARVVVLAARSDLDCLNQALKVGAAGCLGKDASLPEFKQAIRNAVRPDASRAQRQTANSQRGGLKPSPGPVPRLTPRQREILRLIAEGNTTKEIAFLLKVSIKTVETHRAHLMERLNIYNIPGLVRYAMRMGLITWDN